MSKYLVNNKSNKIFNGVIPRYEQKINDSQLLQDSTIKQDMNVLIGENWANYGNCYYYKVGTRVHVHVGIHLSYFGMIFTMPEGYRPLTDIFAQGRGSGVDTISWGVVHASGEIQIQPNDDFAGLDFEYDAFN